MKIPSILIVDDEPNNFDVIDVLLSDQDYELHYADSGEAAIASLDLIDPDLILLDVMMPGVDGITVCQQIKASSKWDKVPIIMVTALTSKQDMAKCLAAGADDYIGKPVNRLELKARVRSMLRIRQQYEQLSTFNARLEATVKERTQELRKMLYFDELTNLSSRTRLLKELSKLLQETQESVTLIYLDCDQFKLVNSSFGHRLSSELLVAIAERLRYCLRPEDTLARMGEDEFCFLLPNMTVGAELEGYISQILHSFEQPFTVANCEIFMSASLGISLRHEGDQDAETLLLDADTAMYQAKVKGKGSYQIFDRQMHTSVLNRLTLENDLLRALEQKEFFLHYQPIINLKTEELDGFEALVRWQHPENGIVSPGVFIPCMETTGLIVPVGMMVLRDACEQLVTWHRQGYEHLTMSVNLSVRQFACPTLIEDIDRIIEETGVNPASLKLEITESAIMDNTKSAITVMEELRSRSIAISIDDFGTGYSSLGYLHQFPVNTLKIDRSFVQQMSSETRNYHVVNTILALSEQLNLSVVAEGIETLEQLQRLQQLDCAYGQGYYFSKPCSAAEIEETILPKFLLVPA